MARSAITVTQAVRAGATLPAATVGDPVNQHTVANNGRVVLLVENTGATVARSVTFALSEKVDGLTAGPRVESVPIGETQVFGPFPPAEYGSSLLVDVDDAELTLLAICV